MSHQAHPVHAKLVRLELNNSGAWKLLARRARARRRRGGSHRRDWHVDGAALDWLGLRGVVPG